MKICIRAGETNMTLRLPTQLVFSKTVLKLGLNMSRQYGGGVPDVSPEALSAFCREIRRIKKVHSQWELVHVQSAGGAEVRIVL